MARIVEDIAHSAGDLAMGHFRSRSALKVERKGHLDLVSEADRRVEGFLIGALRSAFPADGVFGEEGCDIRGTSGRTWVIDPIDGTFNFVRGGQNWAVSLGLYDHRRPVFGAIFAPARDLMLSGGGAAPARLNRAPMAAPPPLDPGRTSVGIGFHPAAATDLRLEVVRFISDDLRGALRCCGSAALSLIEVALGETDGYLSLGDATWDVMAALPILGCLGLSHTIDWDRTELDGKLRFACGSDAFLRRVAPLLARVGAG
jgi:myo-inositol-1(or 4)-monophosphatase